MHNFQTREEMMRHVVKPNSKILEVGVFRGVFSSFLRGLDPMELHLVDPFQGVLCSGDADGVNIEVVDGQRACQEVYAQFQDDPRVHIHRGWSPKALDEFADGYFDVIYLDGDHTYRGACRDLEAAYAKIKSGGYLCGHDYEKNPAKCPHAYTFGVRQAVREFCSTKGQEIQCLGMDGYVSFAIPINKVAALSGRVGPPLSSGPSAPSPRG
jgi:hypothetical protein